MRSRALEQAEKEEELLSLARHATAAQLERLVRAYRGVVARGCAAEQGGPERHVTWSYADDGSLVLRARLPADEGAVVLAALDAGVDRLIAERDASAEAPAPAPEPASAEAPAQASGDACAEAPGRDSVSAEALAPASSMEAPSIGELRADAFVLMADALLARARPGDLAVSAISCSCTSTRRRCATARSTRAVSSQTARRWHPRRRADSPATRRSCRCFERAGKPLSIGRKTRSIPPALRRALTSRDRGCRFPGCTNQRTVDAHHIEHGANGGSTSLENLVQLCRHHHRLVHEGGYTITQQPGGLVFRRPNGRTLQPVPRKPRVRGATLQQLHRRHGHSIDPEACLTQWDGQHMDLAMNVDALLTFAPPEAPDI